MTEAVLEALGEKACQSERSEESPRPKERAPDLSFRTSDRVTGVGIRTPSGQPGDTEEEKRIVPRRADPTAVCALPRNDRTEDGGNGVEEERIVPRRADPTAVCALPRNDKTEGVERVSSAACHSERRAAGPEPKNPDTIPDGEQDPPTPASPPLGTTEAPPPEPDYRDHFASLLRQGEALSAEFPAFDLAAALRDPAFLRLTAPAVGVGVREAWCALHPEALERRGAERARRELSRAAASGALRPREGGGLGAAALTRCDYRALSRSEQQSLKRRILDAAARGEKLYP